MNKIQQVMSVEFKIPHRSGQQKQTEKRHKHPTEKPQMQLSFTGNIFNDSTLL
jgi:hypothetical protein